MVNVSIVTYNTPQEELDRLMAVLRAAQAAGTVQDIEVIDNGAGVNRGYGAAHNIALRKTLASDVQYHLVVNADVYFDPKVLEELSRYMGHHPEAGLIMPRVTYPDGRLQYLCKLLPTPLDLFGRRFLPKNVAEKRNRLFEMRFSGYDRVMNVPYLSGCFMFLRVSALRETGLFDERFFLYPEDIDLSRRIHSRYQTIYYPHCTIIHAHKQGSYHSVRLLWVHCVNICKYFNKWGWWFDSERKRVNEETISLYRQR